MNYVPALSRDPLSRGFTVERVIRVVDRLSGEATGAHVNVVEAGTEVEITLQINSPDDLRQVLLQDLLPGGLEPINPLVERDVNTGSSSPMYARRYYYWWWWRRTFGAQKTLPDRIQWFASYLDAGSHTVTYRARAVTLGEFQHPPTRVESLEQPEVMGMST